jgi:hypothetical protein
MRTIIVTVGALLLAGCVVHERTPAYGYGYNRYDPGPRRNWRAHERHEEHERWEHDHDHDRW